MRSAEWFGSLRPRRSERPELMNSDEQLGEERKKPCSGELVRVGDSGSGARRPWLWPNERAIESSYLLTCMRCAAAILYARRRPVAVRPLSPACDTLVCTSLALDHSKGTELLIVSSRATRSASYFTSRTIARTGPLCCRTITRTPQVSSHEKRHRAHL